MIFSCLLQLFDSFHCPRKWDIYFHFWAQITVVKCVVVFFSVICCLNCNAHTKKKLKRWTSNSLSVGMKICSDVCPTILPVTKSELFSESKAWGKLCAKKENYPSCNVRVLPRRLECCVLFLRVMGAKSFLPLWHVCNQAPWVRIKINVILYMVS